MSASPNIRDRSEQHKRPREVLNQHYRESFERQCRADLRLSSTCRCAWLLSALSHRRGIANMSIANMAAQLNVSSTAVKRALRRLVGLRLFTKERAGRQTKYMPTTRRDFARKVRATSALDLTTRLLWLIVDLSSAGDGSCRKSLGQFAEQLNAQRQNVWAAAKQLQSLELIAVTGGQGRNRPNTYKPNTTLPLHVNDDDGEVTIDPDGNPVEPMPQPRTATGSLPFYYERLRAQRKGKR